MSLHHFIEHAMSEWMRVKGPHSDIVFSSRVRLARNITGMPFPMLSANSHAREVVRKIEQTLENSQDHRVLGQAELIHMQDLTDLQKRVLVEKHLISPHLAEESLSGAVVLSQDEAVSIMINEEDHLRIQCLFPGLQLHDAWKMADALDDWFEQFVSFSFDEKQGYLTSCPTNVGTGIRASVMVHLPALAMTQQLNQLFPAITQVGLAVRGIYGEGSEALGNLYQVSNQITLGQSEEEIIDKLQGVVMQMIEHEQYARQRLKEASPIQLEDRVFRSYGQLKYGRIIDTREAMKFLSDVRLGIDMGLITEVPSNVMNELMVMTQPGFLQQYAGKRLDAGERDIRRAILIRERLSLGYEQNGNR
ncbi:protein arginine kinase [Seinonella peptonophila]|uniref:Protein-arginine kinase n=1 Tax=Seinonella peptonophila TaxID=112248 RepID=A0A1M4YTC2_9BACL|nr:protein arginine kinase [Seinonella peptonophila]SHF09084.1 protein arginine kinase [Seinonella peptonophila]